MSLIKAPWQNDLQLACLLCCIANEVTWVDRFREKKKFLYFSPSSLSSLSFIFPTVRPYTVQYKPKLHGNINSCEIYIFFCHLCHIVCILNPFCKFHWNKSDIFSLDFYIYPSMPIGHCFSQRLVISDFISVFAHLDCVANVCISQCMPTVLYSISTTEHLLHSGCFSSPLE